MDWPETCNNENRQRKPGFIARCAILCNICTWLWKATAVHCGGLGWARLGGYLSEEKQQNRDLRTHTPFCEEMRRTYSVSLHRVPIIRYLGATTVGTHYS